MEATVGRMLTLPHTERAALWGRAVEAIEAYVEDVMGLPISPPHAIEPDPPLSSWQFTEPIAPRVVLDYIVSVMRSHHVHNASPRYFGLFVPAPSTMGVYADALVAAFNPALGGRNLSPVAVDLEAHVVQAIGEQFGYAPGDADGVLTTGGSEANHTAVLTALAHLDPGWAEEGLKALPRQLIIYASEEAHHSVHKAARLCGLGSAAVHEIPTDDAGCMDLNALAAACACDRSRGCVPLMVVATMGTTTLGSIDPVEPLAALAAREGTWLHVDAAWGGAIVLVPECREWVRGVELTDSITFDAHKWLSVPMGAGVFLTKHRGLLDRTFDVAAPYMPRSAEANPYARSVQWSRRFIGLKVFATLATMGWSGYAEMIRSQMRLGEYLRQRLQSSGWVLVNKTRLPVVCFTSEDATSDDIHALADAVVRSGTAWISSATTARGNVVLRACITNHRSTSDDIDALTSELVRVRREITTKAPA